AMIRYDDPTGPNVLTQTEAQDRAAQISGAEYELALSLRAGAPDYEGDVTIRFDHHRPAEGTFLDFTGKEILRLEVNGREVPAPTWRRHRLTIDGQLLGAQNVVRIVYRNAYDHSGVGLHQFMDPEDGKEYLYTQFEPFEAHRMFPCFDQPNIKAHYQLTVTAPSDWAVVSNYPEANDTPAEGGRTTHEFQRTPRFSPYLVALVAGPFHVFKDRYTEVPLATYCRESLAKHMDPEEFFAITRQGLEFFGEFFDFPYPFGKYDQLFVPEFNFGAMENVGCITFSERLIFRDPPTELQRQNRAETILHEMAHMWFGDLVTMQWWNDIWLNESFASYMAYLAMHEATRFRAGAWPAFNSAMKAWAYEQDQLVTTHPISGDVPDTDATFLNFDGITYGKGASALKQLVATIGPDGFREGMRGYFKEFAWGNTTLRDFLGALEDGAGRDLDRWARLWLEEAGCNTLTANWNASEGQVARFSIDQTAPTDHATLRPHRLEVAVIDAGPGGAPVLREAVPVEIDGERTVVAALVGAEAPAAVFPNYGDHAYAKIGLDDRSLAFVRERLEQFEDPFLRLLLWHTLWDMVRDQKFSSPDYLALLREKLRHEQDLQLTSTIVRNASLALSRYVPEPRRLAEAAQLSGLYWESLYAADVQDFRITWARALIGAAQEPDAVTKLLPLADEGTGIEGFELDQDMRWSVVTKAVAYALPDAAARLAAEIERDPSDRGVRAAERARAAAPDREVKERVWRRFSEDRDSSLHILRAAMNGFFWTHQQPLLAEYVVRFFAEVRGIFRGRDKDYATAYFHALYPYHLPTEDVISRSAAVIGALTPEELLLRRSMREGLDEIRRAKACREFAAS
ncbi:MAG: aminopeptidase N, partial [Dehalococcoidia bacterium]